MRQPQLIARQAELDALCGANGGSGGTRLHRARVHAVLHADGSAAVSAPGASGLVNDANPAPTLRVVCASGGGGGGGGAHELRVSPDEVAAAAAGSADPSVCQLPSGVCELLAAGFDVVLLLCDARPSGGGHHELRERPLAAAEGLLAAATRELCARSRGGGDSNSGGSSGGGGAAQGEPAGQLHALAASGWALLDDGTVVDAFGDGADYRPLLPSPRPPTRRVLLAAAGAGGAPAQQLAALAAHAVTRSALAPEGGRAPGGVHAAFARLDASFGGRAEHTASLTVVDLQPLVETPLPASDGPPANAAKPPQPDPRAVAPAGELGGAAAAAAAAATAAAAARQARQELGALTGLVTRLAEHQREQTGGPGRGSCQPAQTWRHVSSRAGSSGWRVASARLLQAGPQQCASHARPTGALLSLPLRGSALLQCVAPLVAGSACVFWSLHLDAAPSGSTRVGVAASSIGPARVSASRSTSSRHWAAGGASSSSGRELAAVAGSAELVRLASAARRIVTAAVASPLSAKLFCRSGWVLGSSAPAAVDQVCSGNGGDGGGVCPLPVTFEDFVAEREMAAAVAAATTAVGAEEADQAEAQAGCILAPQGSEPPPRAGCGPALASGDGPMQAAPKRASQPEASTRQALSEAAPATNVQVAGRGTASAAAQREDEYGVPSPAAAQVGAAWPGRQGTAAARMHAQQAGSSPGFSTAAAHTAPPPSRDALAAQAPAGAPAMQSGGTSGMPAGEPAVGGVAQLEARLAQLKASFHAAYGAAGAGSRLAPQGRAAPAIAAGPVVHCSPTGAAHALAAAAAPAAANAAPTAPASALRVSDGDVFWSARSSLAGGPSTEAADGADGASRQQASSPVCPGPRRLRDGAPARSGELPGYAAALQQRKRGCAQRDGCTATARYAPA